MGKVDFAHFRDVIKRIALDGDVGFARDLGAVADELEAARAVVEAAQTIEEVAHGDKSEGIGEAWINLTAALAAYDAATGRDGG